MLLQSAPLRPGRQLCSPRLFKLESPIHYFFFFFFFFFFLVHKLFSTSRSNIVLIFLLSDRSPLGHFLSGFWAIGNHPLGVVINLVVGRFIVTKKKKNTNFYIDINAFFFSSQHCSIAITLHWKPITK